MKQSMGYKIEENDKKKQDLYHSENPEKSFDVAVV